MLMLRGRYLLGTALLVALATGCAAHVYAPPSRMAAFDAPPTVGEGKTEIGGQFGFGVQVFGGQFYGGGVRVRHGLGEDLEVTGNASYIAIQGERPDSLGPASVDATNHPETETWPIYAGRVGVKWTPQEAGGHFAVTSGVGGGYSDAGGFVSSDIGISVGYNNAYVVPFLGFSGFFSIPVAAQSIDISDNGAPANMLSAEFTYGFQGVLGLRGEISVNDTQRIALMGGFSTTVLKDSRDSGEFHGFVLEAGYQF